MRRAKVVLVAVMTIPLAGCVLSGKPKTVVAGPPPPQPAAPAPPSEPLSIPQTEVVLPAPQPFDDNALNTAQPVEPTAPVQTRPPAPPTRPTHANSGPSKPPDIPPAPEPVEPSRPPIHETPSVEEQKQLLASAHDNQDKTRKLLASARPHTADQRRAKEEIAQFLKQSMDAENAGDIRLADQLSQRALVLAKELQSGK